MELSVRACVCAAWLGKRQVMQGSPRTVGLQGSGRPYFCKELSVAP